MGTFLRKKIVHSIGGCDINDLLVVDFDDACKIAVQKVLSTKLIYKYIKNHKEHRVVHYNDLKNGLIGFRCTKCNTVIQICSANLSQKQINNLLFRTVMRSASYGLGAGVQEREDELKNELNQ